MRYAKLIRETPVYSGRFAREIPGYLWKHKKELGIGAAATGALWLYSVITQNNGEGLAHVIQAVPSITGAYLGAASGKTPKDKTIRAVIGGLLGSAGYEGIEYINRIPGAEAVLPASMEPEFSGQNLIDIPATGLFSAVPGVLLDGFVNGLRRSKK